MKKINYVFLSTLLMLGLASCGGNYTDLNESTPEQTENSNNSNITNETDTPTLSYGKSVFSLDFEDCTVGTKVTTDKNFDVYANVDAVEYVSHDGSIQAYVDDTSDTETTTLSVDFGGQVLNEGVVTVKFDFEATSAPSKWTLIKIQGQLNSESNKTETIGIRTVKASGMWFGYRVNGGAEVIQGNTLFSANTNYTIVCTFDFTKSKPTFKYEINGESQGEAVEYEAVSVTGIKFATASSNDRQIYVDNINVYQSK